MKPPPITVTVQGNAETKISPSTATITFSILTFGVTADAALLNNSMASAQVTTSFENNSLNIDDIELISFTINEIYNWSASVPFLLGYEVLRTSSITLKDTSSVAKVLSSLITRSGANKVSSIVFNPTSAEMINAYQKMLSTASENCLVNAQRIILPLTAAFGQSLGSVLTIQETSNTPAQSQPQRPQFAQMKAFSSIADDQLFSPGQTIIRAAVSCVFVLVMPTPLPVPLRVGVNRRV